jgi:FtsP/CotA-like multicopper oxidase with cupredoxin domain
MTRCSLSARCLILVIGALLAPFAPRAQQTGNPTELRSSGGVLSVTLVAAEGKIRVGDLELDGITYNGDYAGPVLRVHPGDLLRIRLINHLSEPTNLHFHGIRSSPLGNGDNAHLLIEPNAAQNYEVRIPVSQPLGLYWYHAHAHHFAEHQTMGGLTGTFIVEDSSPLPLTQRLFVLKDMVFEDDTGNTEIDDTLHGVVQSVNGQLLTAEAMRPGETQLWRFTNQSADRFFHIALAGHRFHIVGRDGEPSAVPDPVDLLDIAPGSRFDVLVDSGEPGRYSLVAKGVMTGTGSVRVMERVIGYLDVAGEPTTAQPAAMPVRRLPRDLATARIDERRTIVFTETTTAKETDQRFFINGKMFDAERMDVRAPLGNIEEWTIRNDSDDLHIFHIHQIGFQVVEVNGKPIPFTGYVDNILVPERGEVKLRLPFTDPTIVGRFMFHCHVLRHEDLGMMANIEIYDPASPTLSTRLNRLYLHVLWWWNGVPWSLCGLPGA